jgi:glyoxylase-like metal-dependent hydrolase (beta-lactamase superfamily II)
MSAYLSAAAAFSAWALSGTRVMAAVAVMIAVTVLAGRSVAQSLSNVAPGYAIVEAGGFQFQRIAEGVLFLNGGLGGRVVVIVNDDDVVLVDTGAMPRKTAEFLSAVRDLTGTPVRYVVNTHWHYDHTDGNQVFGPDVRILAHEAVYSEMTADPLHREPFKTSQPLFGSAATDALRRQLAQADKAADKAALTRQISAALETQQQLRAIMPTPPDITYSKRLILHAGNREIDLLFLGRGHTSGDTVVYLPREKIVCTGDLMESGLSYLGDSYPEEWIVTLDALKRLDWTVDLPGHGEPFGQKEHVTAFQAYLRDLMDQLSELRRHRISAKEAARRVDLTAHARDFPQIAGLGAEPRGVKRIYDLLAENGH